MADEHVVVGADGVVLTPSEIAEQREYDGPQSVGDPPDTHPATLLRVEIERARERIKGIEDRIPVLEADLVARGPSEVVDGDLREARRRLEQLRSEVEIKQAEYDRLTA